MTSSAPNLTMSPSPTSRSACTRRYSVSSPGPTCAPLILEMTETTPGTSFLRRPVPVMWSACMCVFRTYLGGSSSRSRSRSRSRKRSRERSISWSMSSAHFSLRPSWLSNFASLSAVSITGSIRMAWRSRYKHAQPGAHLLGGRAGQQVGVRAGLLLKELSQQTPRGHGCLSVCLSLTLSVWNSSTCVS